MRFDYYSSSLPPDVTQYEETIISSLGGEFFDAKPIPRYPIAKEHRSSGLQLFTSDFLPPFVRGSGEAGVVVADLLRHQWPSHRPSRLDVCFDFVEAGGFDRIDPVLLEISNERRVANSLWSDPRGGRTRYLGSRTSEVIVRMYEKGLQAPENAALHSPHWVRIEIQTRPAKNRRNVASTCSPEAVWGFSKWSQLVAERVLDKVVPFVPRFQERQTDFERSVHWMCKQYSASMKQFAALHGRAALHRLVDRSLD